MDGTRIDNSNAVIHSVFRDMSVTVNDESCAPRSEQCNSIFVHPTGIELMSMEKPHDDSAAFDRQNFGNFCEEGTTVAVSTHGVDWSNLAKEAEYRWVSNVACMKDEVNSGELTLHTRQPSAMGIRNKTYSHANFPAEIVSWQRRSLSLT